ncbi:MFS transporter [Brevibacillus borstelensis]|uniref:Putative proline/betaine transporter n=1 Tax=Brevibacillus borstelensis AK1 TaxID=1300222 RepID=M8DFL7_9BACL|nr:MFS transporter [Brevibacillus borstelensis]EMT52278.1 general substrate transporter [Brevibacillus borstelensis AK1]MCM3472329.1 MHS family MFS transporter [Brevibacillus borstelensis]MCM3561140.1 MHS family MFS transporter [Brevibacillus borstelensis]MCM3590145.1 MHS family MFS transporter [Brevibacillus borstelensis]MED1852389.1 MFS transporter [Brevibacillus borstelensis]
MAQVQTEVSKRLQNKALVASLVGSSIEWFDFFLYGTMASLVFNKLFFPSTDPTVGLLLSYLSFGLPFFIRPLGGIIFSHIGDKIGRKKTLVLTLSLMGGATVLIGLLPDYNAIGVWAPILLVTMRLIQGLGIGGEWGGALLLAVEYSGKGRRGFFGSIPQMGVPIGMLLGTLAVTVMSSLPDERFMSWGWRVPFILSAGLVFLGLWIRNGLDETPAFQAARESGNIAKVPIIDTFRYHWKSVLIAVGAKVVETGPFYIFSTFVIAYATGYLGYDRVTALNAVTIATLVTTIMIPYMGKLSDKLGRKPLYIGGTILIILYAFPYFYLLSLKSGVILTIATIIGLGILWAPVTAVLGTMFSEIFSTNVRYTGVTVGYQLGAALAGGTAPLIATALLAAFDNSWVPVALYIVLTGVISLIAIGATKETKDLDLDNP